MESMPKVVIIMARCSKENQAFGIRLEEKSPGEWIGDWAFALKEKTAKKEGFGSTSIAGSFAFSDEYPGCPHCKVKSLVKCDCEGSTCWDGETRRVKCSWCGKKAKIAGEVKDLKAGHDR